MKLHIISLKRDSTQKSKFLKKLEKHLAMNKIFFFHNYLSIYGPLLNNFALSTEHCPQSLPPIMVRKLVCPVDSNFLSSLVFNPQAVNV